MATYINPLVLDGGLDYLIAQGDRLRLLNGYTHGDTYTAIAAATVAIATISSSVWAKGSITNGRQARIAAGLDMGLALGNAVGNLHYAITRESDQTVLFVADAPDRQIIIDNPIEAGVVDARIGYTP